MSLSPEIRDQAYQFFVEEAQELLQTIEMGLLNLQYDRSPAQIHEIMRAAHSLKGGAASVGLEAIKTISHRLETIFKALYSNQVTFDSTLETALLQGYDCLQVPLKTQIDTGSLDEGEALRQSDPVLSALETLLGDAIQEAESYMPTSEDLGVDIVASIFEVDVTQGLERWQRVLTSPEAYPVAGELRAQLEVFAGLGEILELPGFGELTRVALAALDQNPDRPLEVLAVALVDFQEARDQVLQGDRRLGGTASAALQRLADGELDRQRAVDSDGVSDGVIELAEIPSLGDIFGSEPDPELLEDRSLAVGQGIEVLDDREVVSTDEDFGSQGDLTEFPSLDSVFGDFGDFGNSGDLNGFGDSGGFGDFGDVSDSGGFGDSGDSSSFGDSGGFGDSGDSGSFGDSGGFGDSGDSGSFGDSGDSGDSSGLVKTDHPLEGIVAQVIANFDRLPSLAEGATGGALMLAPQADRALVASPAPPSPETTTLPPPSHSPVAGRSVRVDLQRLERMNNLVGELAINRNSLSLQHEQLQSVVRELGRRLSHFQDLLQALRQSSDLLLVNTAQSHSPIAPSPFPAASRPPKPFPLATVSPQPTPFPPETATSRPPSTSPLAPVPPAPVPPSLDWEFDQLEMDRYSQVHSQLQEVWEEAIQLEEAIYDINLFTNQSSRFLSQQGRQLNQLQNELLWSRMLPLSEVLNRFPRILRDLSNRFQKPVGLKLTGSSVLIDKSILDKLHDPLLHLLRNAFDHGVEPLETRLNQGKPGTATIEIRAYHRGNQTVIEIQDDGRGIDLEQVSRRALELGWITPESLGQLKANQVYNFLFESGFSTATEVTELSGRGVGLDVVKSQIESLKGSVSVTSTPRQGTTFSLRLPLTLTLTKLLIIQADQLPIALPSDNLEELVIPQPAQLKQTGSSPFLHWRNQLIPYYNLATLIQYACPVPASVTLPQLAALQAPPDWLLPMLIVRRGNYSFALQVDRILTEQELVIKPFNPAITPPPYLYGCTVLGDGRLVPVMDASLLIDYCHSPQVPSPSLGLAPQPLLSSSPPLPSPPVNTPASPAFSVHPTVLVVDDSTALRQTLALTLQKAGYRVLQARDGLEALTQLQTGQPVGLVICDVEMPNMNGFEFLNQRRQQPNLAHIPVFMLTSRSNQKHRKLAETLGATSYFTKPYLEQELLKALTEVFQSF